MKAEVIDEANLVVVEYALREEHQQGKRARVCKCASCLQDYQDALDRRSWTETFEPAQNPFRQGDSGDEISSSGGH